MSAGVLSDTCALWARAFDYPDAHWADDVDEYSADFAGEPAVTELLAQVARIRAIDEAARCELYVQLFDLSNDTSLYLTSRGRSDGPEQRADLLAYSVYFEEAGFEVDQVLPDYLGALLELLSVVDEPSQARIARSMLEDVERLAEALRAQKSGEEPAAFARANQVDLSQASAGDEVLDRALSDDEESASPCSACAAGHIPTRDDERSDEREADAEHARASFQARTQQMLTATPDVLDAYISMAQLLVSFLGSLSQKEAE